MLFRSVFQDGGNNYIWVVMKGHTATNPKVSLFGCVPSGSEPTGITFSPDNRFMFMSIQHPFVYNTAVMKDATGRNVVFNASSTLVIGLKQDLGSDQTKVSRAVTSINLSSPIKLYPNPTNGIATIDFTILDKSKVSIKFYNSIGQVICSPFSNMEFETGNYSIETPSNLTNGFYFVEVRINNEIYTEKLIKL